MKYKHTKYIVAVEMISGIKLLKLVNVPYLLIELFCKLITKTYKKAVLVKHIIGDLHAGIDMDLVIEGDENCFCVYKITV